MRSKIKLTLLNLLVLSLLGGCQTASSSASRQLQSSQALKLYPIDEASQDPSFADFRNKLLEAARRHDVAFILNTLDPQVINNSDGGRGVNAFKNQWNLERPESRIWETLTTILQMGGSFRVSKEGKEFCAPYVSSKWPSAASQLPKDVDPLDYEVITDKDVAVCSAPNPTAPVITSLSYDVVRVHAGSSQPDGPGWVKITTAGGQEGYVLDRYLRSPSDYQACFKRVRETWVMTELAARE